MPVDTKALSKKMLSCPFCGLPGAVVEVYQPEAVKENYIPYCTVGCADIKCRGFSIHGFPEKMLPSAIVQWNKRPPDQETKELWALSKIREVVGCGSKPMADELVQLVADLVTKARRPGER
jgi:hypothetical protein